MSGAPTPLFTSTGSVYRRQPHSWQDEDEAAVDASIPSTPIDESHGFITPPEASSSDLPSTQSASTGVKDESSAEDRTRYTGVKVESAEEPDEEDEPLRSVEEVEEIEQRARESDERLCRICFAGAEDEDSQGKLISPCLCTGTMRYVHVNCINAWRGTGTNAKAYMECPQCHHQYRLRRTLVSGLATSRPVLLILTTIMFTVLTILTGSLLHLALSSFSSIRERVYTARTPVSSVFSFNDEDDDYWDDDGTVIIIGGGGTLIYDIVLGSIQMFTALAIRFAHTQSKIFDMLPDPLEDVVFWVGIRFLLGLAVMGSFSFLSLLLSFSLFGPLQIFNSLRGVGLFRRFARRRTTEGGRSLSQVMIVVFVMIGTVRTLFQVYEWVRTLTHKMLVYVETQILEVNPDDRRKAKEQETRRREASWIRRWWRDGRYRHSRGWWELLLRTSIWLKIWGSNNWEAVKARMANPMDPLEPVDE